VRINNDNSCGTVFSASKDKTAGENSERFNDNFFGAQFYFKLSELLLARNALSE
jgi:hypothetical protein